MAKFYVDSEDKAEDEIELCWTNAGGEEECIKQHSCQDIVVIHTAPSYISYIYKEDLHKLKTAIEKAIELGWDK